MSKYIRMFKNGIKKDIEYQSRLPLLILANLVFIYLISTVWSHFIGGDIIEYLIYFTVTELILSSIVIDGKISSILNHWANMGWHRYMIKPLNKYIAIVSNNLGKTLTKAIIRIIIAIIILAYVNFQISLTTLLLFIPIFILTIIINSIIGYILGLISFFIYKNWGIVVFINAAKSTLGGGFIPLWILPKWGIKFLNFLPFIFMYYYPAQFFITGELNYFFTALYGLIFWTIITAIIAIIIDKIAMKKFESQGG